jgi:hypothetical protein
VVKLPKNPQQPFPGRERVASHEPRLERMEATGGGRVRAVSESALRRNLKAQGDSKAI